MDCRFSVSFAFKPVIMCFQQTTPSVAEPVYTEKVTLSFMASQDWVQDAELDLARQFDEKTGIGVNYQIFPSSQYNNLLMTKLNTGECPDIFAAQSGKFDIKSQYCVEKNAIDLSNTKWASRTEPLAAAELSVDGRLYGQPTQDVSAVWALGYNKKIFEELNLAVQKVIRIFTGLFGYSSFWNYPNL